MYLLYFRANTKWFAQWQLIDVDGSLTGGLPKSKVVPYSPLYNPALCKNSTEFSGSYPAQICSPEAKFARMAYNKITPSDSLINARITVENTFGITEVGFKDEDTTNKKGWLLLLPTGLDTHIIRYPDFPAVSDITYSARVSDIEVNMDVMRKNLYSRREDIHILRLAHH